MSATPIEETTACVGTDGTEIVQVVWELGLRGGIEAIAFELHRAWLAQGQTSRVLTTGATEAEARSGIIYVAPWLHRLSIRGKWQYVARLLVIPTFTIAATWRILRMRRTALIISHGDALAGDICVANSVHLANLVRKIGLREWRWLLNPLHGVIVAREFFMLRNLRYRRVIAVSQRVREELRHYYRVPQNRIAVIPNGVNLARYNPGNRRFADDMRHEFAIPAHEPVVLFVGHEFRRKGLAFVIRALALVKPNIRLLIAGSDNPRPYRRLAEQLDVTDRTYFVGPRNDMDRVYAVADALVFPTSYEAFPLACLEAMASGVPLIACRVGGIEDYLQDGYNGLYVERDHHDIASKLAMFVSDDALRVTLARGAVETARRYSWPDVAKRYITVFKEVTRERQEQGKYRRKE